ncbi:54S ribosomal protein L23, mitochondrial [Leucoagaricus sp. SymC.cos]|nr:54S ribosomal protein L23, mitochondrial [Leucoagaricus sp. SymC.cos]
MQSLCRAFGTLRLYSTRTTQGALAARTASTPQAVRLRRNKKFRPPESGESDATRESLTPSDWARYKRRLAAGLIGKVTINGTKKHMPAWMWAKQQNERRSRLRGVRMALNKQGQKETQVVGQPVYLPNIIFRLVRNYTPPGQPYNPYEATFRVPHSVTKTDIRSYLLAVYGVKTTYIRTDNYFAPIPNLHQEKKKTYKSYKRAVVGLVDPFYYPHRMEDLPQEQRTERQEWIEQNFHVQQTKHIRKLQLLRITQGTVLKAPYATKRSHVLKLIAERRQKREGLVSQIAEEWKDMRERGEEITWGENPLKKPSNSETAVTESSSS